jgi:ABC-type multidrug transport system fused ATPase/permease subunit
MSLDSRDLPKKKKNADFWRACRFLYPHRRMVIISVLCALFVGAAFTSGLSTLLPIMRVLINGETVQSWANRQITQQRLGIKLVDNPARLQIAKINDPDDLKGLSEGDVIVSTARGHGTPEEIIGELSSPQRHEAVLRTRDGRSVKVHLDDVPGYLSAGQRVAGHLPTNPVGAIGVIFGMIAILAIIGNIFRFFQEYLSDKAAILAVNDIRRKLYDHVLHIPMGYFGLKGSSDVTSRLVQDTQGLESGFKTTLGQSIQEPIRAAMALGLALLASWQLTLFIIAFGPVMVIVIKKFGKKMRRANRKALQSSSSMLGQIEGTLIGIRVVKAAGAERFERRRYTRIMDDLIAQQLKMSRIDAWSTPTMETLTLLVVGAVLLFASYLVLINHTLTVERFFLVMACLMGIGESLRRLGKVNNVLSKASAAAGRIFEALEVPVERRRELTSGSEPRNSDSQIPAVKLATLQKEIHFDNVTFSYHNATTTAVSGVDLTVRKGQSIAIVGRNGSGKTTLLAMLPRFYDPQSGRVLIDGVDVRNITLRSLRRNISIVTQDAVIFPGTIADNIAYGDPLPDRGRVIEAAKRAFAHDFILEKQEGYDTLLGEMGGQLSGGQKQRLCIARAIYRAAPILILDEATSQVDAESEHLIQQAIEGLMQQCTTFVIAHRFSTILSADTIVVMERGRIVGQGSHQELLSGCEVYQQLYERQLIAAPV